MLTEIDAEVKAVLIKVRKRLHYLENWTTSSNARDITKTSCGYADPSAVCWCLNGALYRDTPYDLAMKRVGAFKGEDLVRYVVDTRLREFSNGRWNDFIKFNDNSSHDEVIGFLDWVIASL